MAKCNQLTSLPLKGLRAQDWKCNWHHYSRTSQDATLHIWIDLSRLSWCGWCYSIKLHSNSTMLQVPSNYSRTFRHDHSTHTNQQR